MRIWWLLQQGFHGLNHSFDLPVALQEMEAACCVLKSVALSKVSKFLGSVLGVITTPKRLKNAVLSKNWFQMQDDGVGPSGLELNNFRIMREIITTNKNYFPFCSNRSVATTCHGYSGRGIGRSGCCLWWAFRAPLRQFLTNCSTSLDAPGHRTKDLTLILHLSTP